MQSEARQTEAMKSKARHGKASQIKAMQCSERQCNDMQRTAREGSDVRRLHGVRKSRGMVLTMFEIPMECFN